MARPQNLKEIFPGFWRVTRQFWPYLRHEKGLIGGAMGALMLEVLLRLLEPWPLKLIFDGVISPSEDRGRLLSLLPAHLSATELVILAVGASVGIAGLRALMAYVSTVGFALVGNRVLTTIRHDLYCHLQRLSLTFHSQAKGGDLTLRVISDVGILKEVIVTAFLPLLANVLILLGMVAVMLWLNPELMLLVLATVPLFALATLRLSRKIRGVARQQRKREGAMAATAAESIQAIKIVKTFSLEHQFARAFASHNQKDLKAGVKTKRLEAGLERTIDVLVALVTALVLGRGTQLVLTQSMTPGDLLVFLTYLKNVFRPLRDFAKYTGRLAKATAAGDRILDLFAREPTVQDLPQAQPAKPFRGEVVFHQVSFAYHPEQPILQHLDFAVKPGQTVALVGDSGSGKSTLSSLVLRLYDPQQGSITLDGQDIRHYTLRSLRSQISVVLQESWLFAASIWDNIAYGKPGATPEEIITAAKLANAHQFITETLPQGYETILGERGVTLSGGQRQRIAIARAAIRQAPILILDEPTTGLDRQNETTVLEALERLAETATTFLISHDLTVAARADLILYLEQGKIVEQGTHAELAQCQGRYAARYQLQNLTRQRQDWETRHVTSC